MGVENWLIALVFTGIPLLAAIVWRAAVLDFRVRALWRDREAAEEIKQKIDLMRQFQVDRGIQEAIQIGMITPKPKRDKK